MTRKDYIAAACVTLFTLSLSFDDPSFFAHIGVSAVLVLLLRKVGYTLFTTILAVMTIGITKELIDPVITYSDLFADGIGILTGIVLITSILKIGELDGNLDMGS